VGVVITAGIVAAVAVPTMGLDWRQGLLLGAIVGPTDAAAVFSVLRHPTAPA
jgi:cell volume regulation protein A